MPLAGNMSLFVVILALSATSVGAVGKIGALADQVGKFREAITEGAKVVLTKVDEKCDMLNDRIDVVHGLKTSAGEAVEVVKDAATFAHKAGETWRESVEASKLAASRQMGLMTTCEAAKHTYRCAHGEKCGDTEELRTSAQSIICKAAVGSAAGAMMTSGTSLPFTLLAGFAFCPSS